MSNISVNLKKIESIDTEVGQKYVVIGYFLIPISELAELNKKEEDVDIPRGMWTHLGTYNSEKKAEARKKKIVEDTGITSISVKRMYEWQYISLSDIQINNTNDTNNINTSKEDFILDQIRREKLKIKEEREKDEKIRKSIDVDIEREADKDSIEYYTRQWWLTIKNKSYYEIAKREMDKYKNIYEQKLDLIGELDQKHPTYANKWKEILKPKLNIRNEQSLYELIDKASNDILSKK